MGFWNKLNGKNDETLMPEDELTDGGYDGDESGLNTGNTAPALDIASGRGTANVGGTSVKLLSPKSHTEAIQIADELMKRCIVVLDVHNLDHGAAVRMVDFLAGVIHVLGGSMKRTNESTLVVAPNGVDIAELMPETDDNNG